MPSLDYLLLTARANCERWTKYVETDKDKLVYTRKFEIEEKKMAEISEEDDDSSIEDDDFVTEPPKLWHNYCT